MTNKTKKVTFVIYVIFMIFVILMSNAAGCIYKDMRKEIRRYKIQI
jgi:preprotein translocase subunit SecG